MHPMLPVLLLTATLTSTPTPPGEASVDASPQNYARCAGEYWAWSEITSLPDKAELSIGIAAVVKGSFLFKAAASGMPVTEAQELARLVQVDRRDALTAVPTDDARWAAWAEHMTAVCDALPNPLENGIVIEDEREFLRIWARHSDGPADLRAKVGERAVRTD